MLVETFNFKHDVVDVIEMTAELSRLQNKHPTCNIQVRIRNDTDGWGNHIQKLILCVYTKDNT